MASRISTPVYVHFFLFLFFFASSFTLILIQSYSFFRYLTHSLPQPHISVHFCYFVVSRRINTSMALLHNSDWVMWWNRGQMVIISNALTIARQFKRNDNGNGSSFTTLVKINVQNQMHAHIYPKHFRCTHCRWNSSHQLNPFCLSYVSYHIKTYEIHFSLSNTIRKIDCNNHFMHLNHIVLKYAYIVVNGTDIGLWFVSKPLIESIFVFNLTI